MPFYHDCNATNILNNWIGNTCIYISIVFFLQALSELHDQIPPFPRTVAMKIMEEEFGCPLESFFSYISEEPMAAASFGQVLFCYDKGVPFIIKYYCWELDAFIWNCWCDDVCVLLIYVFVFSRFTLPVLLMVIMLLLKFSVLICIMWWCGISTSFVLGFVYLPLNSSSILIFTCINLPCMKF